MLKSPSDISHGRKSVCVFILMLDLATPRENSSQAGYIAAFCSESLEKNEPSPWSPFTWKSMKLPRVVSSTLGAESQIFSLASSTVEWMSLMIAEARTGQFDLRSAVKHPNPFSQSGTSGVKIFGSLATSTGVTDCKSLYDHLQSLSSASKCDDKRIAIDLSIIKQAMHRTGLSVRWCPTELQLADGLTKDQQDPADLLRAALSIGEYQLNPEASILSLKKQQREERLYLRKMLQQQESQHRSQKIKFCRQDRVTCKLCLSNHWSRRRVAKGWWVWW